MEVTVLSYKLFTFKADLAAILNRACCHIYLPLFAEYICVWFYSWGGGGGGFEQRAEQWTFEKIVYYIPLITDPSLYSDGHF